MPLQIGWIIISNRLLSKRDDVAFLSINLINSIVLSFKNNISRS